MSGLIWVGDEEDLRVKRNAHSMLILSNLGWPSRLERDGDIGPFIPH